MPSLSYHHTSLQTAFVQQCVGVSLQGFQLLLVSAVTCGYIGGMRTKGGGITSGDMFGLIWPQRRQVLNEHMSYTLFVPSTGVGHSRSKEPSWSIEAQWLPWTSYLSTSSSSTSGSNCSTTTIATIATTMIAMATTTTMTMMTTTYY